MTSRSIASASRALLVALCAALVAAVVAWPGVAHARKRLVVLEFTGPKAEEFQADLEKLLKKRHSLVPLSKWDQAADSLGATKVTDANVKRIAGKLNVDGVIVGKSEKRGNRYYLHLKLRAGASGKVIVAPEVIERGGGLGPDGKDTVDEELLPVIDDLPALGGDDDDDDDGGDDDAAADDDDDDRGKGTGKGKGKTADRGKPTGKGKGRLADDDDDDDDDGAADDDDGDDHPGWGRKGRDDDRDAADDDDDDDRGKSKGTGKGKTADRGKPTGKGKGRLADDDDDDDRGAASDDDDDDGRGKGKGRRGRDDDDADDRGGDRDDDDGDDDRVASRDDDDQDRDDRDCDDCDDDDRGRDRDDDRGDRGDHAVDPRPAMDLAAGLSFTGRRLGFTTNLVQNAPQGYRGAPVPGIRITADAFPLAFNKHNRSFTRNLGVTALFDRAIKISSELKTTAMTYTLPTVEQHLAIGVVYRHPVSAALTVEGSLRYNKRKFVIDKRGAPADAVDIPNTDYTYVDPGVGVHYWVNAKTALAGDARFLLITDTGEMQSPDQYGASTVTGVDLAASLDYVVAPKIVVRVAAGLATIGYAFKGNGALTNNRDGQPTSIDVSGARDTYYGGTVGAAYQF